MVGFKKLKGCKSPGVDQIPAELIQAGGDITFWDPETYSFDLKQGKNCVTSRKR
jgi:hypothetical protein